jgi:thiopurine S-methyltransferase
MDSAHPEFWEQRYRVGQTPWDLRGAPPALHAFLARTPAREGMRHALIPGCGFGYEVAAFHAAGWRSLAVDFSPVAVAMARERLGPLGHLVREADFFTADLGGPYDLIYERTFLCSRPLERRAEYAARMAELLRPGGLLAGVFYYGDDWDGPPFPVGHAEAAELFHAFERIEDASIPAEQSTPLFAGTERWQVWRRRPQL